MKISHLGREDTKIQARCELELPGILNWAIGGWRRLKERGHFVKPESSHEQIQELTEITSPILAFIGDMCEIEPHYTCECDAIFDTWNKWRTDQGYEHSPTKQHFGRELRSAVPSIKRVEKRGLNGSRSRHYEGIRVVLENTPAITNRMGLED